MPSRRLLVLACALCLGALALAAHAGARPGLRTLEGLAETHYGLPVGLLARVREYEGDKNIVILRRGNLISGKYQINCGPSWLLARLARSPAAPWIAAQLLDESRAKCSRLQNQRQVAGSMRGCKCDWIFWNYNDRTALCASLAGPGGET